MRLFFAFFVLKVIRLMPNMARFLDPVRPLRLKGSIFPLVDSGHVFWCRLHNFTEYLPKAHTIQEEEVTTAVRVAFCPFVVGHELLAESGQSKYFAAKLHLIASDGHHFRAINKRQHIANIHADGFEAESFPAGRAYLFFPV
jgi:hypothetical protein